MGLADRDYMRERRKRRDESGCDSWNLLGDRSGLIYHPLVWMTALLLLYVAATVLRPYLPNYGAVYCYVWTATACKEMSPCRQELILRSLTARPVRS